MAPRFERTGRHDAVYSEDTLVLYLTVEAFQEEGHWGTAVYLSQAETDLRNPKLSDAERERIGSAICRVVEAEGRLCSIE